MTVNKPLSASLEDYLEVIFHLVAHKRAARVRDISERLAVSNSSVTGALRALAQRKLVNYAPYELITLTARGKNVALDIIRRHEALRDFFTKILAVDRDIAEDGACRMEHTLPREVLDRLVHFVEFVEAHPNTCRGWLKRPDH